MQNNDSNATFHPVLISDNVNKIVRRYHWYMLAMIPLVLISIWLAVTLAENARPNTFTLVETCFGEDPTYPSLDSVKNTAERAFNQSKKLKKMIFSLDTESLQSDYDSLNQAIADLKESTKSIIDFQPIERPNGSSARALTRYLKKAWKDGFSAAEKEKQDFQNQISGTVDGIKRTVESIDFSPFGKSFKKVGQQMVSVGGETLKQYKTQVTSIADSVLAQGDELKALLKEMNARKHVAFVINPAVLGTNLMVTLQIASIPSLIFIWLILLYLFNVAPAKVAHDTGSNRMAKWFGVGMKLSTARQVLIHFLIFLTAALIFYFLVSPLIENIVMNAIIRGYHENGGDLLKNFIKAKVLLEKTTVFQWYQMVTLTLGIVVEFLALLKMRFDGHMSMRANRETSSFWIRFIGRLVGAKK